MRIPIKATAREPIKQAGYISATSETYAISRLRTAVGPYMWVLREYLDLTGTKYGCGIAQCGSCTVHINGEAQRSCVLPFDSLAETDKVVTIEGLSPDGSHPVQMAWLELDVPQCGYCQTGMIMAAAALLAKTPKPTDEQIDIAAD